MDRRRFCTTADATVRLAGWYGGSATGAEPTDRHTSTAGTYGSFIGSRQFAQN